ncbi:phosphatase PAP2 family protein [Agrococcus jejuensis]|uniref:Undecaprenyl-diphosphatase n=1 Tax=Agrococcus jejuensis TaxID=399736 RepID=A0A1G8C4H3_9MICO|nr:phosphatase PAP2 family protein [Agrococcus jejuensis]SDH40208.1 undecaprenyl-diphosphatase [Agrococcus jejuensis]
MRPPRPAPLALGGLACVVALVALAAAVGAGATEQLDVAVHAWAVDARTEWMASAATALAVLGGTTGAVVMGAVVVLILLAARRPWAAIAVAASALGAFALSETIKAAVGRLRPEDGLLSVPGASFPSGHATEAAALAVALAIAAGTRWWVLLAAAWMTAMAASRLVLGVHWLSDVAGGLLLGTATALLVWALVTALRRVGRRPREASTA